MLDEVGRGVGDDVVEVQGEESITNEDGHIDAEDNMVRGVAIVVGGVIHTGQVVMDEGGGMSTGGGNAVGRGSPRRWQVMAIHMTGGVCWHPR